MISIVSPAVTPSALPDTYEHFILTLASSTFSSPISTPPVENWSSSLQPMSVSSTLFAPRKNSTMPSRWFVRTSRTPICIPPGSVSVSPSASSSVMSPLTENFAVSSSEAPPSEMKMAVTS